MIVFDTETTGLDFTKNNICQLSYIKVDADENFKVKYAKNFFFTVDRVEPGAERVHGFSVEKLKELSNGKKFQDFAAEIYEDFKTEYDCIVGHNVEFDLNFLCKEFNSIGYDGNKIEEYVDIFCTMKSYTDLTKLNWNDYYESYKWPKLKEVVDFLELNEEELESKTQEIFNLNETVDYHDARLDVVTTLEIAKIYKNLSEGIHFKDDEHFEFYFEKMINLPNDVYYKSLIYTLAMNETCRRHFDEIFDIDNRCINPNCLEGQPWLTGASERNINIAFDLFNGFKHNETITYLLGYGDSEYYINALKIRFDYK